MGLVVSTKELCKAFDSIPVVKNCTIEVQKGSIYGLLGANGAGKTTIFKLLSGLLAPTSGSAEILGLDIIKSRTAIQQKIGAMIDVPVFYEDLSATENLRLHLAYMNKKADVAKALVLVGIEDTSQRPVSKFSLGMRQRLAIARAVVHGPELLILDEPTNGLDPAGIIQIRELFVNLVKEQGVSILISSHILAEIEHVADTIGMIKKGSIIRQDSLNEIKKQYAGGLEDFYMDSIGGS